ncbi:MAG: zinc ABC transporter ATP-binding protein, partial [Desulfobacterales bacterium]|nr:zinc ABC transporter ATP-binding protein [Desulfobacterales bacterium]
MSQKKPVVEITQVDFAYDGDLILEDITLSVEQG